MKLFKPTIIKLTNNFYTIRQNRLVTIWQYLSFNSRYYDLMTHYKQVTWDKYSEYIDDCIGSLDEVMYYYKTYIDPNDPLPKIKNNT